jgi:hypothetical protein
MVKIVNKKLFLGFASNIKKHHLHIIILFLYLFFRTNGLNSFLKMSENMHLIFDKNSDISKA